jgi:type IV pilus assembly protein PilY1
MFCSQLIAVRKSCVAMLALTAALISPLGHAEDIDLFVVRSGVTAAAPNLMIMLDNSANWSRAAQQWPDNSGDQGAAELQALLNILASPVNANIGLGMYTKVGNDLGGYIRYGIRDVSGTGDGPANRAALRNVLGLIKGNINDPIEKVNDNNGEAAALYEIYKYYNGMSPFRGMLDSRDTPNADKDNNAGSSVGRTAFGQHLSSGFAIKANGDYSGAPVSTCGRNYVVFIVNNAEGKIPEGQQTYQSTSAGAALPLIPGVSDVSWTDEWARFLYNHGISVYILDAYYAQQNASHSAVLKRAAEDAGGHYIAVRNQTQIELAIKDILAEIRAINSTFAAASLPISATNRSQNLNQVFIGMFRPSDTDVPRWMGNLKQYQLGTTASGVDLVDRLGQNAVNSQTGFVTECAASLWTTDSGSYWQNVVSNSLARSGCVAFPTVNGIAGSEWSDMPDGPTVEKGGVAEVLRKGNNPPDTNTSPTWVSNRAVATYSALSASKLAPLTTTNSGWSSALLNWVLGSDDPAVGSTEFIDTTGSTPARTRPSIHGDVIHSRPLPVNYGAGGVTVFYGANDGMLRAVNAANGKERWAYVAPEHYAQYQRLHDNTPLVTYGNADPTSSATSKKYFFDGSIGIYQKADNSKVWIFPSMRRGGRMLYGFDVTDPALPRIKWRVGCANMTGTDVTSTTSCTSTDFYGIGQTWSLPNVAYLKGYTGYTVANPVPVVVVGGGYDGCEDADSPTPTCPSDRKGRAVYVLDADTGAVIKKFTPPVEDNAGSFAADVAMSDADGDDSVDFAYAVDTKGNIYRIDFSDSSNSPVAESSWAMHRVGYTTGAGRKFLYPPSLLRVGTKMYVAVGSGDRERPLITNYPFAYNAPTGIKNRFYVLLDDLSLRGASVVATAMDSDAAMKNFTSLSSTSCNESGVTPTSGLKGWFMDLPNRGEQVVTSALIAAGMVAFNTNHAVESSDSVCTAPLGEARGYWLNLVNASGAIGVGNKTCGGDRSSVFVGGGLTPSPTLARVVIGDKTTTVAIGAANREGGVSVPIDPQEVKPVISSKRKTIYWKANSAD